MVEWTKIGTDVMVGGVAGVVDQVAQNQDNKREDDQHKAGTLKATEKLPIMKRFGTYVNYGVPLLSLFGIGLGYLKGEMATRLATISGQLAAREVTHTMTTKVRPIPAAAWNVWERSPAGAPAPQPAPRSYEPEFKGSGVV